MVIRAFIVWQNKYTIFHCITKDFVLIFRIPPPCKKTEGAVVGPFLLQ